MAQIPVNAIHSFHSVAASYSFTNVFATKIPTLQLVSANKAPASAIRHSLGSKACILAKLEPPIVARFATETSFFAAFNH
jgi:hypothetical protein